VKDRPSPATLIERAAAIARGVERCKQSHLFPEESAAAIRQFVARRAFARFLREHRPPNEETER
jgi:hypothetical protein